MQIVSDKPFKPVRSQPWVGYLMLKEDRALTNFVTELESALVEALQQPLGYSVILT